MPDLVRLAPNGGIVLELPEVADDPSGPDRSGTLFMYFKRGVGPRVRKFGLDPEDLITSNDDPETDPILAAEKGQPNGVATLGPDGKVPMSQLPPGGVTYPLTAPSTATPTVDPQYSFSGALTTGIARHSGTGHMWFTVGGLGFAELKPSPYEFRMLAPLRTTGSTIDAPLRFGTLLGNPAGPANGDVWYDSTLGKFRGYEAGAAVDLRGSGTNDHSALINLDADDHLQYFNIDGRDVTSLTASASTSASAVTFIIRASSAANVDTHIRLQGQSGTAARFYDSFNPDATLSEGSGNVFAEDATIIGPPLYTGAAVFLKPSDVTDVTLTDAHCVVNADANGAPVTVNLPDASATHYEGQMYLIKKTDATANTVTIDAAGANTIDGAGTYVLSAQYDFVILVRNTNGDWHVFSSSAGGGGGAPADAQYLVLAANGTLTDERVFTPGSGIAVSDGGPGGAYTVTNTLLTGSGGGQTVIGGAGAGNNLRLQSTSHATRGQVIADDPFVTTSTATLAGFQVGAVAGDPSALVNGNVWYDSTAGKFRARQAGVSVDMIGGVTFPILADDGTEAAPSYAFTNGTGSGMWLDAQGPSISANGSKVVEFRELGGDIQAVFRAGNVSAPSIAFDGALTTGLWLQAAGEMILNASGTAVALVNANDTTFTLNSSYALAWGSSGVATPDVSITRATTNNIRVNLDSAGGWDFVKEGTDYFLRGAQDQGYLWLQGGFEDGVAITIQGNNAGAGTSGQVIFLNSLGSQFVTFNNGPTENTFTFTGLLTTVRQASRANLRISGAAGDASVSLTNGDIWYNSTSNQLRAQIGGSTVTLSGSGGAAPADAQYLVLAASTLLANERVFTAGSGIAVTDGGAGSTYTVANTLRTGLAGGQTVIGGTAASENLTLSSTSNATKGSIISDSVIQAPDGSGTAPAYTFSASGEQDLGMYRVTTNTLAFAAGGAGRLLVGSTNVILNSTITLAWGSTGLSTPDIDFTRAAAGALLLSGQLRTTATSTLAALRIGSVSADPSTLADGDMWYDSTANEFKGRKNGATVTFTTI